MKDEIDELIINIIERVKPASNLYHKDECCDNTYTYLQAKQAILTLKKKWEQEYNIRTLETVASLANQDKNAVEVIRNYVRNKLEMYKELNGDK